MNKPASEVSKKPVKPGYSRGLDVLNQAGKGQRAIGDVFTVPVDQVDVHPQVRKKFDPVALANLTERIRTEGQRLPCEVYREGDRYVLMTGERRLRAVKELGDRPLEVKLKPRPESDNEIKALQITENEREDLSALEIGEAIRSMVNQGDSKTRLANRLGMDRSLLNRYLRLAEAPPEIQSLYTEGVTNDLFLLYHLSRLNEVAASQLSDAVEGVRNGRLRRAEIKHWVDDAVSGHQEPAPTPAQAPAGAPAPARGDNVQSGATNSEAAPAEPAGAPAGNAKTEGEGGEKQPASASPAPQVAPQGEPSTPAPAAARTETPPPPKEPFTSVSSARTAVQVKAKTKDGYSVEGHLMLDRIDQDARYAYIMPESGEPVRVALSGVSVKALLNE